MIDDARVALGGVAARPWRSLEAEAVLHGRPVSIATLHAAADAALARAVGYGHNDFKIELAKRTLVATLARAAEVTP
jgi:xanthine dehydrogenase YagS FAD-binding subunit